MGKILKPKPQEKSIPEKGWYKDAASVTILISTFTGIIASLIAITTNILLIKSNPKIENEIIFVAESISKEKLNLINELQSIFTQEATTTSSKDLIGLRVFGGECDQRGTSLKLELAQRPTSEIIQSWGGTSSSGKFRPLARSLLEALSDLSKPTPNITKTRRIIAITTGGDNCEKSLSQKNRTIEELRARINNSQVSTDFYIIGYKLTPEEEHQINSISRTVSGIALTPHNTTELRSALNLAIKTPPEKVKEILSPEITKHQKNPEDRDAITRNYLYKSYQLNTLSAETSSGKSKYCAIQKFSNSIMFEIHKQASEKTFNLYLMLQDFDFYGKTIDYVSISTGNKIEYKFNFYQIPDIPNLIATDEIDNEFMKTFEQSKSLSISIFIRNNPTITKIINSYSSNKAMDFFRNCISLQK